MPSASRLMASALIGPSTIEHISLIRSLKSLPSLDTRDGFVVTPSTSPHSFAFLISAMFAVSIKNFMLPPLMIFLTYYAVEYKLNEVIIQSQNCRSGGMADALDSGSSG